MNIIGKAFSGMLNERLCKWIERVGVLVEKQNVDRRAEDNMFVVDEFIERQRWKKIVPRVSRY